MKIQPLTASQEEKYRQMAGDAKADAIQVKPVNMEDKFNTTNLQAALAEGVQDFIRAEHAEELHPEPVGSGDRISFVKIWLQWLCRPADGNYRRTQQKYQQYFFDRVHFSTDYLAL